MAHGFVVVGSGPAGLEAARAYRSHGGGGPVRIVTHDEHLPYARPPLSKEFLRGTQPAEELELEDAGFYDDHDIEVLLRTQVTQVDASRRVVALAGGRELGFDACLLATGARAVRPDVPGAGAALLLRSRTDAAVLVDRAASAHSAVVVGSGFIGCEAAASLALRGLRVTVVTQESDPQAGRLGDVVADRIAGWLAGLGVRVVAGRGLASVEAEPTAAVLDDGQRIEADLVLVAAGVTPEVGPAERAGAHVEHGRVVVDASMRTSLPGVWAAGDVVLAHNVLAGRALSVEHWGEAERMGEIAGANAAGGDQTWAQVPGFWSQVGDHTLKYAAWGDGFDQVRVVDHGADELTAWYGRDGVVVGVLAVGRDEDYDRGRELVESRAAFDSAR